MKKFFLYTIPLFLLFSGTLAFAHGGPGLYETPLTTLEENAVGNVHAWNSGAKYHVEVVATPPFKLSSINIYIGAGPVPLTDGGRPLWNEFPFSKKFKYPQEKYVLILDLEEDLGFRWGRPFEDLRVQNIAVHAKVSSNQKLIDKLSRVKKNTTRSEKIRKRIFRKSRHAWARGPEVFEHPGESVMGWWFTYLLAHPMMGQFIDAPVKGLSYNGPTQEGTTSVEGGFPFFPDENIEFSVASVVLGDATSAKRVSPLDLFTGADTEDPRVIGVARILQILDSDGKHGSGSVSV